MLRRFFDQVIDSEVSLLFKIAFIAHQEFKHFTVFADLLNIFHMQIYRFVRSQTIHGVLNNECMGVSVKHSNSIFSFRRIPHIEFNLCRPSKLTTTRHINNDWLWITACGVLTSLTFRFFIIPLHDCGFTHAWVSNHHYLVLREFFVDRSLVFWIRWSHND